MKSLQLTSICKKHHLDLLMLFGSRAAEKINHLSDLDLAFCSSRQMSIEEENKLFEELMRFYKRGDIDLININTTPNIYLRYQVFINGDPLYEKKSGLFAQRRWEAYIDFVDFKRFFLAKSILLDKKLKDLTADNGHYSH